MSGPRKTVSAAAEGELTHKTSHDKELRLILMQPRQIRRKPY